MATPTLTPTSQTSAVALPITGTFSVASVSTNYPYGLYVSETKVDGTTNELYDANFVSGAVEQVAYTFKKLGGDVLDIELDEKIVYSSYEEAVLEYSYIVNIHQAKNILHSSLGATTGTFDHDGQRTDSLSGSQVELKYPKFMLGYANKVMDGTTSEAGLGGSTPIYSASVDTAQDRQDYDLQAAVSSSAATDSDKPYYNKIGNKRVTIHRVFFKTPHAMWRFYGYYGGLNAVGNLATYGMYADDSTFEIIPPWQNKAQAMAYEEAIYTRNSHYSYEIKNNKLRIYPLSTSVGPGQIWFEFSIDSDPWEETDGRNDRIAGVNSMNTLPLANIPYSSINSIGKQWIRRFSLSLAKEILGQVRSKFGAIPIPNANVTLNGKDLVTQGKAEQKELREELQKVLDELTYQKMTEIQKAITDNTLETGKKIPMFIYVG
jgi:hypothetical protein